MRDMKKTTFNRTVRIHPFREREKYNNIYIPDISGDHQFCATDIDENGNEAGKPSS